MSLDRTSDSEKSIVRSSLHFLSGTFLSRLSGLGRDTLMAATFGASPAIAAFMVAFRFANLIRRLFGEGSLAMGFIPQFEKIKRESEKKGAQFFRDLLFFLVAILVLLLGAIEFVLWGLLKWGHLSSENQEILFLTILMMPGVLFICLFGLNSAFLQCERRYFSTGFAPVAFNIVWMITVFSLRTVDPNVAMVPLSLAIILAFFVQWAMLVPQVFSILKRFLSWKEWLKPNLFSIELKKMAKPFFLGIIGVGATQINSTLDAIFARCASLEGPAYLWYAIRIQQVPLALFGIALSSALLPPLARAIKEENLDRYLTLLQFALRKSFSLIFPCTLGMFVLAVAGINLIYGHGDFNQLATYETVICLWGYALGLLPAVCILLLAPAFYAKQEYRIPMIGSVVTVVINILLNSFFVFILHWGSLSIALATSLSTFCNCFYLFLALKKKMNTPILTEPLFSSFLKITISSVVACLITFFIGQTLLNDPTWAICSGKDSIVFSRVLMTQLVHFVVLGTIFLLTFFLAARVFRAQDALDLLSKRK